MPRYRTVFHLHTYHNKRRLRLAISKSDMDLWVETARAMGLPLRIFYMGEEVYPRFGRIKDGRLVLPTWFVEKYGLKPCNYYPFTVVIAYQIYKVKVRIYNEKFEVTPKGTFQGFYLVTLPVDENLMPVMGHSLSQELMAEARRHFVSYWNGQPVSQKMTLYVWMKGSQPYRDSEPVPPSEGIAYSDSRVSYLEGTEEYARRLGVRPVEIYAKDVPAEFIEEAEKLSIEELVIGVSSVYPTPAKKRDLGVWWQEAMIIKKIGRKVKIAWHDRRGAPKRIYPAEGLLAEFIERVQSMEDVYVEEG